jgi:hypothetical protein
MVHELTHSPCKTFLISRNSSRLILPARNSRSALRSGETTEEYSAEVYTRRDEIRHKEHLLTTDLAPPMPVASRSQGKNKTHIDTKMLL